MRRCSRFLFFLDFVFIRNKVLWSFMYRRQQHVRSETTNMVGNIILYVALQDPKDAIIVNVHVCYCPAVPALSHPQEVLFEKTLFRVPGIQVVLTVNAKIQHRTVTHSYKHHLPRFVAWNIFARIINYTGPETEPKNTVLKQKTQWKCQKP